MVPIPKDLLQGGLIPKLTTLLTGTQTKTPQKSSDKNTSPKKTSKRTDGDFAEDLALAFFKQRQFQLIERNFNCRLGELDLIMQDQGYLVFIEVRYRVSAKFGGALESITPTKQTRLRRTAELYLQKTKTTDSPCRFDILCVDGNLTNPEYQWIKNAF